jgi:predicted DNA binding protein
MMRYSRLALALMLCFAAFAVFSEGKEETAEDERTERLEGKNGYQELVYRGKELVEELSYDAKGALLEEKYMGEDSLPYETRSYIRVEGRLERIEARDGSDVAIGSMRYRYDHTGRLLGLDAEGSFGEGSSGMISTEDGPQGTWTQDGVTTILAYDGAGRAIVKQTVKDGEAQSIEKRGYGEKGSLSSVSVQDKASGTSSELVYDEEGRLSSRKETKSGGAEIITSYRYDKAGRLVEESTKVGEHTSLVSRSYAEDGSIERVETRRDGVLLLSVETIEGGRVEELYDSGQLFVKATYLNGRKVKDEFYIEGSLARTREYR